MSLILPIARRILNYISTSKVADFENALKNPEEAQKKLLDKWEKNKTYLEKIENFEYTSGSSGAKKRIGHTKSLKKSFSDMFQIWSFDVLNNAPVEFKSAVIYMSISPRLNDHGGLKNDTEYISFLLRPIMKLFLAVNPSMQRVKSGNEFYLRTSRELLSRNDLEIISIWSPSYLVNLLDFIKKNKEQLNFSGSFKKHWPNLKMISAWSTGESEVAIALLKEEFPDVWFQGKGLLATEGPMTIPWIKSKGQLPLVNYTYFEFLDDANNKKLLHQLVLDQEYEICPRFPNMKSTYLIGDRVKCTGFYFKTPLLEFIGRKGDYSDLVGEKLSGQIVRDILMTCFSDFVVIPNPLHKDSIAFYTLIVDKSSMKTIEDAHSIDLKLQNIHHYKLARELGQLDCIRLITVDNLKSNIKKIQTDLGIRDGDQKDLTIINRKEIKEAIYKWPEIISSIE